MTSVEIVKIGNLITIVRDTHEEFVETYAFLKEMGVEFQAKNFSDYMGDAIKAEHLFYYSGHPDECPVHGPHWMF